MPLYSQDVLEDLRQGNDIIDVISQYIPLKQRGANYVGLCPFHNEKSPSVSVSAQKQLFHCFGCGASGNVFSFIQKIENYSFMDTIKFLADRMHYILPEPTSGSSALAAEKNIIYDILKKSARFYYDALQGPEGSHAARYLDSRRISPGIRRKFGLGYSQAGSLLMDYLVKENFDKAVIEKSGMILQGKNGHYDRFRKRLMFPIFDVSDKVVGFGGRIIGEGNPKYLNSPETPVFNKSRLLYGLNSARKTKTSVIILVEGYMDVIALHQHGIKNSVAALGTSFTASHATELKKYCKDVIILFDGDNAGAAAVNRAIPHLYVKGLGIRVASLPGAKDPDEYLINFGPENFLKELNSAVDFVEYQIEAAKQKYDIGIATERVSFLREAAGIIGRLNSGIEKDTYMRELSSKYSIDPQSIKLEVDKRSDDAVFTVNIKTPPAAAPGKDYTDAVSHILYSMALDTVLYDKISSKIDSHEMGDELYSRLYDAIANARARGRSITAADVISAIEEPENQQKAASIFAYMTEYSTQEEQYKALAQQIKLVKTTYYRNLIQNMNKAQDFEKFNTASIELKKLENQTVTL